jgi:hypothetical protein
MTHVELIVQERDNYIEIGKMHLQAAMDFLNAEADSWDEKRENIYQGYLRTASHNLSKVEALCALLKKLGV